MEFFYPILIVLFMNFINIIFGATDHIILQHPTGIAEFYSDKISRRMGTTNFRVLQGDKGYRKSQCILSFQAVHFQFIQKKEDFEYKELDTEISTNIQKINDFYGGRRAKEASYVALQIQLERNNNNTSYPYYKEIIGVACLSQSDRSWAIGAGFNNQHFFVIGETELGYGKFQGLVEEISTEGDTQNKYYTETQLDLALMLSENSPNKALNKSIHTLDYFNRFRACSSAYMIYEGNNLDRGIQHFVRESEDLWFVEQTSEVLDKAAYNNFRTSASSSKDAIEVIPCAVDRDPELNAVFYLTMDHSVRGAVFILGYEEGGTVKIKMRVRNVLALNTLLGRAH